MTRKFSENRDSFPSILLAFQTFLQAEKKIIFGIRFIYIIFRKKTYGFFKGDILHYWYILHYNLVSIVHQ